jgi:hypothetical protein
MGGHYFRLLVATLLLAFLSHPLVVISEETWQEWCSEQQDKEEGATTTTTRKIFIMITLSLVLVLEVE